MQYVSAPPSGRGLILRDARRRIGLAAVVLILLGTAGLQRGDAAGETRTLNLYNIHTKNSLTVTYKRNGRMDDAALKRLNHFLRDWRRDEETRMDPQLFDMLWEVHREVKATGPIHVVSGYRSPNTNAMLRGRSRNSGVARTSLHMQGKAIDFSIPTADVAAVRAAALRVQGGGVGYYPTSGVPFVHMDVGNVRHWPRMTRDQLAKVFPDGRTLHVPTDGNPMPGYQLALADRERGVRPGSRQEPARNLLASLFGGGGAQQTDTEEAADTAATAAAPPPLPTRRPAQPAPAAQPEAPVQVAAIAVPLPLGRPARAPAPFQVASAETVPTPAPTSRPVRASAAETPSTPNQTVAERGLWEELTTTSAQRIAAAFGPTTSARINPLRAPRDARGGAPELVMAYAAEGQARAARWQLMGTANAAPARGADRVEPAQVTTRGSASVAHKPGAEPVRAVKNTERLADPWLRGVVMATDMSRSMTATVTAPTDTRTLEPFLSKPAAAVAIEFKANAEPAPATNAFSGDAVAFPPTVAFTQGQTPSR